MRNSFDPVGTWIRYGLSDLYFGSQNQENALYRYGTFFYIMAAEKHLKAVLIDANRNKFDDLESVELQKESIENIVKSYSHNFRKMIKDVSAIYVREMGAPFLPDEHLGFKSEKLIAAMYEGYMETRYPSVLPTSRHFPTGVTNGMFHSPLGSSFFTDFIEVICIQCWTYLNTKKLNTADIIAKLEEHFEESAGFEHFKALYLEKLPIQ